MDSHNSQPTTLVSLEAAEGLRHALDGLFQVWDTTLDAPEEGFVRFRGQFLQPPEASFGEIRQRFERFGFTPMVREDHDRIAIIAMPVVFDARPSNRLINLALLIATIFTTLWVGAQYETGSLALTELWRG